MSNYDADDPNVVFDEMSRLFGEPEGRLRLTDQVVRGHQLRLVSTFGSVEVCRMDTSIRSITASEIYAHLAYAGRCYRELGYGDFEQLNITWALPAVAGCLRYIENWEILPGEDEPVPKPDPRQFEEHEEYYNALLFRLFKELLISLSVTPVEGEQWKYTFSDEQYIVMDKVRDYVIERLAGLAQETIERVLRDLPQLAYESGFFCITFDEHHFPPLKDTGINPQVMQMIKLCVAVLSHKQPHCADMSQIEKILDDHLPQLTVWDDDILEQPAVKEDILRLIETEVERWF